MSDTRTVALSGITIRTRNRDGATVVEVTGELDVVSCAPLLAILTEELDLRPAGLVTDLTGTMFLSAAGINTLTEAAAQARTRGIPLVAVAGHRVVVRPLEITGVAGELNLQPTVDRALSALPPPRTGPRPAPADGSRAATA